MIAYAACICKAGSILRIIKQAVDLRDQPPVFVAEDLSATTERTGTS